MSPTIKNMTSSLPALLLSKRLVISNKRGCRDKNVGEETLLATFPCLLFPDGSTVINVVSPSPPSLLAVSPAARPGIVTTDK